MPKNKDTHARDAHAKDAHAKDTHAEEYCLIYVVCGSLDEAQTIGNNIVQDRLVACVNIFSSIHSIYWWQDKVEQASEWIFTAKTRRDLSACLIEKITALHSYETPCILVLPVLEGNREFLDWIDRETGR